MNKSLNKWQTGSIGMHLFMPVSSLGVKSVHTFPEGEWPFQRDLGPVYSWCYACVYRLCLSPVSVQLTTCVQISLMPTSLKVKWHSTQFLRRPCLGHIKTQCFCKRYVVKCVPDHLRNWHEWFDRSVSLCSFALVVCIVHLGVRSSKTHIKTKCKQGHSIDAPLFTDFSYRLSDIHSAYKARWIKYV